MEARGAYVKLEYADREITAQVEPYLISLTYTDHLDGKNPDTLVVLLADDQGLFRGTMRPVKGSALYCEFGYKGEKPFRSGRGFLIDEIKSSGGTGGDTVEWTASANLPGRGAHSRKSKAWTDTTLDGIVAQIADAHGLEVRFEGGAKVQIKRHDQIGKSDLELVRELTRRYGLTFSVKAGKADGGRPTLVVTDAALQKAKAPVLKVLRGDCTGYSFCDDVSVNAKGRRARYFDPATKKLVEEVFEKPGGDPKGQEDSAVVREALPVFAGKKPPEEFSRTGELELPGHPELLAGAAVELPEDEWMADSGEWLVVGSTHTLSAGGYTTKVELKGGK